MSHPGRDTEQKYMDSTILECMLHIYGHVFLYGFLYSVILNILNFQFSVFSQYVTSSAVATVHKE